MSATQVLQMQQQGKQQGMANLQMFAQKLRMNSIMQELSKANIQSPEQLQEFFRANNVTMPEAQAVMGTLQQQQKLFPKKEPIPQFASAGGGTVFNKYTGEAQRPYEQTDYFYATDDGQVIQRKAKSPEEAKSFSEQGFIRGTYEPGKEVTRDYFRVRPDGSVVSRVAKTPMEANMFEKQGFERGKYTAAKEKSGGASKPIETWILPKIKEDGTPRKPLDRIWNAPSDKTPPKGAIKYSGESNMEHRMLVSQEASSIRQDKRILQMELSNQRTIANFGNSALSKAAKERVKSIENELQVLKDREEELLKTGNTFNLDQEMAKEAGQLETGEEANARLDALRDRVQKLREKIKAY